MPNTVEKLLLAAPRGYCAGVDRAVQTVERALELHGAPVYVRKEIVHNKHVVEQLRERGAIFVDEQTDVPEGAVCVFSAHGVAPSVRAGAQERGAAHDRRDLSAGHEGAPRGRALRRATATRSCSSATTATRRSKARWARRPSGSCSCRTSSDVEELEVDDPERIAYVTQTTLAVDETTAIIARLRERFPEHRRPPHRRHLLRDHQPPGGRQADGRQLRPDARDRLAQLLELGAPGRGGRATAAPRRT